MKRCIRKIVLVSIFSLFVCPHIIAAQEDTGDILLVDDTVLYGASLLGAIVGGVLGYVCASPPKEQLEEPAESHWIRRFVGTCIGATFFGGGLYWWLSKKTPEGRLKEIGVQLRSLREEDLIASLERTAYQESDGRRRRGRRIRGRVRARVEGLVDDQYGGEDRPFSRAYSDTEQVLAQLRTITDQLDAIAKYDESLVEDVEALLDVDTELYQVVRAFNEFIEDSPLYGAEFDRESRLADRRERESKRWWGDLRSYVDEKVKATSLRRGRTGSGGEPQEQAHKRGFSLQINFPSE